MHTFWVYQRNDYIDIKIDWTFSFYLFKEKENRQSEGLLRLNHISSNSGSSGSLPKRYQSVFTEGTPLTSFGLRNDDNQLRSHSVQSVMLFK